MEPERIAHKSQQHKKSASRGHGILDYRVSRWALGEIFHMEFLRRKLILCVGFVVIGSGGRVGTRPGSRDKTRKRELYS